VYATLKVLAGKKPVCRSERTIDLFPSINLHLVWGNLSQAFLADAVLSLWYVVIHGFVPTNVRLHSIYLIAPDASGETDTLLHRLTECGARMNI
jgi:hypothetical protein